MTNADKIRGMPTEDLAEMLEENYGCPPQELFREENCDKTPDCGKCWINWLNTEVSNDTKSNLG